MCAQPSGFLGFVMGLSNFSGSSGSKGSGAEEHPHSMGLLSSLLLHWAPLKTGSQ